MRLREKTTSRVWRKTVEESFATNLDGGRSLKVYWCNSCRQHKPQADFYVESNSKAKFVNEVRKQCVPCWDKKFGSTRVQDSGSASLFDFLK